MIVRGLKRGRSCKKTLPIIALAFAVSGCASSIDMPASVVSVTPTDAEQANGLDVYAASRANNPGLPPYRGVSQIEVRTFFDSDQSGDRKEIDGATCTIDGGGLYTAEISPPRIISVPNYGSASPLVGAQCTKGDLKGSGSTKVYNEYQRNLANTAASAGLLGLAIGAAVGAATADDNDPFAYDQLVVELK